MTNHEWNHSLLKKNDGLSIKPGKVKVQFQYVRIQYVRYGVCFFFKALYRRRSESKNWNKIVVFSDPRWVHTSWNEGNCRFIIIDIIDLTEVEKVLNLNSQKLLPKCLNMLYKPEIDATIVRFVSCRIMRNAGMKNFEVEKVLSKLSPILSHRVIALCSIQIFITMAP